MRSPHPPLLYPDYTSTRSRAPRQALIPVPAGRDERCGPVFSPSLFKHTDADLTKQSSGEPIGVRLQGDAETVFFEPVSRHSHR
jgi:hypothetical protein